MDGCPWFFYRRFWDGCREWASIWKLFWMYKIILPEVLGWMLVVGFVLDVENYSIGGSGMDVGSGPAGHLADQWPGWVRTAGGSWCPPALRL